MTGVTGNFKIYIDFLKNSVVSYFFVEKKSIEANTIKYENENFWHHTESDLDKSSNR